MLDFHKARRSEGDAEFAAAGEEHSREKAPEPTTCENDL